MMIMTIRHLHRRETVGKKLTAIIEFEMPDPNAMYLRMVGGTVETTEFKGTKFGAMTDGGSIYIDIMRDGELEGTLVIPAATWVEAFLKPMRK